MRFEMEGLNEVIKEMTRLGELSGAAADAMILSGAAVVADEWRKSARRHGHVDTGAMVENIGFAKKPRTVAGMRMIAVYPQGSVIRGKKKKHETRNAEKASVLHYGTTRIAASGWIDEAEKNADAPATTTMTRVWDEYIQTGKVPAVAGIRGKGG